MNRDGPHTPRPSDFSIVDGGCPFSALDQAGRARLTEWVEGLLRPAVLQLAIALDGLGPVLRAARIGIIAILEEMADGQIVPRPDPVPANPSRKDKAEKQEFKGAMPLCREEILGLIRDLHAARQAYFEQDQQDRFARVCGPETF
jgi:hypothetical protein